MFMNQAVALNLDDEHVPHLSVVQGNVRQDQRFLVQKGFVAFNSVSFGEVLNISEHGMAIQYLARRSDEQDQMTEVNLINSREGFLLSEIPCRMAYVKDSKSKGQLGVVRRIGIEFVDLTTAQQQTITALLDRFTVGEESQQH